jgi:hypothetical protein
MGKSIGSIKGDEMNIYYIDSGEIRFYAKKTEAQNAASKEADKIGKPVVVSKMFIAIDRENIARMANKELGFTRFVGRIGSVLPRKRPKVKMKRIAATLGFFLLLLPNPSDAASCVTRRSGSESITTCSGKNFHSRCRSYRSGSVIKTHCR